MTLRVTFLGHATVVIELDGARLLTDPVLGRRVGHLRRHGPQPPLPERLDAVLVSHAHADHLDVRSLRRLGDATVITTAAGAAHLRRRRMTATVLRAGDAVRVGAVSVMAVPARHDGRRLPIGRPAEAIGFRIEGSRTVYFAGDTELFGEMADVGAGVDLAMLPVAGWGPTLGAGHMGPAAAARAAALIRPVTAMPIHWGSLAQIGSPAPSRQPATAFVRELERRAPYVRALVLDPGQAAEL